jgi:hypothetical protein
LLSGEARPRRVAADAARAVTSHASGRPRLTRADILVAGTRAEGTPGLRAS